jgi:hypothetical protein
MKYLEDTTAKRDPTKAAILPPTTQPPCQIMIPLIWRRMPAQCPCHFPPYIFPTYSINMNWMLESDWNEPLLPVTASRIRRDREKQNTEKQRNWTWKPIRQAVHYPFTKISNCTRLKNKNLINPTIFQVQTRPWHPRKNADTTGKTLRIIGS